MAVSITVIKSYKIFEEPEDFIYSDLGMSKHGLRRVECQDKYNDRLSGDIVEDAVYKVLERGKNKVDITCIHYAQFLDSVAQLAGYESYEPTEDEKRYGSDYPYLHSVHYLYDYHPSDLDIKESPFAALLHSSTDMLISNEFCKIIDAHFDEYAEKADKELEEWKLFYYKELAKCVKEAAQSGGFLRIF